MSKKNSSSVGFLHEGFNPHSPTSDGDLTDLTLEMRKIDSQEKKEERGLLGKLWGSKEHSSNNIVGLFLFMLFLAAVTYTAWLLSIGKADSHSNIIEFWKTLSPMMTLSLGYLFGKNNNQ